MVLLHCSDLAQWLAVCMAVILDDVITVTDGTFITPCMQDMVVSECP